MISSDTTSSLANGRWATTFRHKGKKHPITISIRDGAFHFAFKYNKALLYLVKTCFERRRYNPDNKSWHAPITERNLFQIDSLTGHNPYEPWALEVDLSDKIEHFIHERNRRLGMDLKLFPHQLDMMNFALSSQRVILAAEMGLGKTLVAILLCEYLGLTNVVWVAPNGPLAQAKVEFRTWQTRLSPRWFTFMGLVNWVKSYEGLAPQALVVDESAYIKNLNAQRTQAAGHTAASVREEMNNPTILLLTGKADPKTPVDWHSQVEVIQPGAVTEAHPNALQDRLALVEIDEELGYRKIITWWDDERKCKGCGQFKEHPNHEQQDFKEFLMKGQSGERRTHVVHKFQPSINEVKNFGGRLKGLVKIWRKEDCVELPARKFHMKKLEPSQDTLNTGKRIVDEELRATDTLLKLRMLSDGFRYKDVPSGEMQVCRGCNGKGKVDEFVEEGEPSNRVTCGVCEGVGKTMIMVRETEFFGSPKEDYLRELLEMHYECGKFVVYGAFQATIDIVTKVCLSQNWQVFQADGRGWFWCEDGEQLKLPRDEMLERFQKGNDRVCFVGQPGSAGSGLTLHASPSVFFYSNDTNPNNRFQAADRIHRLGMSEKGGNIYDVIHLPSDERVIKKLIKSQQLSEITMQELKADYNG